MDDLLQAMLRHQADRTTPDVDEFPVAPSIEHLVDGFPCGAQKRGELGLRNPDPACVVGQPEAFSPSLRINCVRLRETSSQSVRQTALAVRCPPSSAPISPIRLRDSSILATSLRPLREKVEISTVPDSTP
jgi:hypothetical protein